MSLGVAMVAVVGSKMSAKACTKGFARVLEAMDALTGGTEWDD